MTAATDRRFDAVLFDWCGTLVEYPRREDRLRPVLQALGRGSDDDTIAETLGAIRRAEAHPDVVEADRTCDLSEANHAATKLLTYEIAGLDRELAEALERTYADLTTYRGYPEVIDVVSRLHESGVRVVVVSDFHVDLRPHFRALGILDRVDGFAISCEVGATKPDPAMFEAALELAEARPERCLMVGDNPRPDGGAAALGIQTLLLPVVRTARPPLLNRVLSLVLGGD